MSLSLDESLAMARAFAAHIRDPATNTKPLAVPEDRMEVYRSLFFNSMTGFLNETYEHLQRLLSSDWPVWQRRFFAQYQAQSPYFHRISSEFLTFLQTAADFPPELLALAQYEQHAYDVEVLASVAQPQQLPQSEFNHAMLFNLRPGLRLEGFEYDISKMLSAKIWDNTLSEVLTTPVFFAFYRNNLNKVTIKVLTPITVALLALFEKPCTPTTALTALADSMQLELKSIQGFGFDFIQTAVGEMLIPFLQH